MGIESVGEDGKVTATCNDPRPINVAKAQMVEIDDDIANRAVDFIKRQKNADKPFSVWVNFTHMHSGNGRHFNVAVTTTRVAIM